MVKLQISYYRQKVRMTLNENKIIYSRPIQEI